LVINTKKNIIYIICWAENPVTTEFVYWKLPDQYVENHCDRFSQEYPPDPFVDEFGIPDVGLLLTAVRVRHYRLE
jgi:hypothetical protein